MSVPNRIVCLLSILLLFLLPVRCESATGGTAEAFKYASFRDIPGVTEEEIAAVDALREEGRSFVYGMNLSTEAFIGENDEVMGFTALFCEWLAGLFDIPFAPSIYEWSDLLAGLETGEIDFTGDLTPTDERRETYFMTDPIAMRMLKYIRIENRQSLAAIEARRPLRLVFAEGSVTYDNVVSSMTHAAFEPIFVRDFASVYALIKSGRADAFIEESVSEAAFDIYGDVTTEDFFPLIHNAVSMATQNAALEPVVSVVQKALINGAMPDLYRFYSQGQREYTRQKFLARLTDEEREYIKANPVVYFGAETDNYPVSFYNSRENEWQGIAFDVLREVEALTGLSFEIRNDSRTPWHALLNMLENGDVSFVTELIRTEERARRFLWPGTAILVDNYVLLSRTEYPNVDASEIFHIIVGLPKATAHTELFKTLFPNHGLSVEYENIDAALAGMMRDEVELVMAGQIQILILTNYLEQTGYKINYQFDRTYNSTFGFHGDEEILCSIVDKALSVIDTEGIAGYWMRMTFDYRIRTMRARIPIMIGATVLTLGIVFMLIFIRRNRNESRRLEELVMKRTFDLERQHALTQTLNLVATAMLTTTDDEIFEESLLSGMELLCECMDVDRVEIWQNEIVDGELRFVMRYESLSASGKEMTQVQMGMNIPQGLSSQWEAIFLGGGIINSLTRELPEGDREFLNHYEIKSFLAIPLFLQGQFWGVFTADDCGEERVFSDEEVDIFRSASLMMGSAVYRFEQAAKIRDADALTQLMQDAMPLSCALWDKNLNILACNDEAVKLYELTNKQDFIDRFDELLPEYQPSGGPSKKIVRELIEKTFEEGYRRFEWMYQTLDGEPVPTETTLVRLEHGGEYMVAAYDRDLREYKAMLAEIQKVEDDLRLARDAAEAASVAKSAFLANMSHEIRTPMNSIMGFSELAMDDDIAQKTRGYLTKIRTNAEWLLQIINDILDISKIESGKMELEKIPFDMHELFTGCRTLILPKAAEKGLMLHFYAEPSFDKMPVGDPTRLRQVFVNLLSNAIKFTSTGMIKLYSEVKDKSDNTVTIRFEIKDSGIGMTQDQIDKIFEPFIQAESSTTRKYGGTGLGLAITKNIVELMGGKLLVESAPGVGSKFSFTLTFDTIDISGQNAAGKRVALEDVEKPNFEGEILLCEDNPMNQQVICEHLARVGFKTVIAENGRIGVDMVTERLERREKMFDLIFMDMHMPVMDGLEAAGKIIGLNTGIPIVAMTANIMAEDRETYRKSGMNDCVGKPFTSQELWRCLLKYFNPVTAAGGQRGGEPRAQSEDKLRQKLIDYFLRDNRAKFKEITEAIDTGDIKLAHRLAHTLKGNAGHLGKILLQQAAAEVEKQLKDGSNNATPEQMKTLETELAAVLAEFTMLAGGEIQTEAESPAEPLDAKSARELIEKLEPMLDMGNPECRNFSDDLRRIPGSEELIRQMDELDFEPAAATLAELKKKVETMDR